MIGAWGNAEAVGRRPGLDAEAESEIAHDDAGAIGPVGECPSLASAARAHGKIQAGRDTGRVVGVDAVTEIGQAFDLLVYAVNDRRASDLRRGKPGHSEGREPERCRRATATRFSIEILDIFHGAMLHIPGTRRVGTLQGSSNSRTDLTAESGQTDVVHVSARVAPPRALL